MDSCPLYCPPRYTPDVTSLRQFGVILKLLVEIKQYLSPLVLEVDKSDASKGFFH